MKTIARRDFIKTAGVAASTLTLAPFAIGKAGASANSKLNIAMIGVGGIGGMALQDSHRPKWFASGIDTRFASSSFVTVRFCTVTRSSAAPFMKSPLNHRPPMRHE